ncbi:acyltransferase [Undibacterium sp. TS12]|uniref:LpxL/LpxP family acyltransferase n=1 Tax=Undibacterium sp. TS12 TaxID=2908202 RepID=UPI001F4D1014|nr:acyltransferase [Undibacterium sp. TS12]MCH8620674.1 acyltransferase [Undibacterium sp. TS12]
MSKADGSSGRHDHHDRWHWASLNEVSFVAGMHLLFWVFRIFGRWPFRLFLYPVLAWYVLTKKVARKASLDYLARVQAYTPVSLGWPGVMKHFAAFAENILDKMLLWGGLFDASKVEYSGQQQMHGQLQTGRGALLICSHLGNLEMCRVLSRRYPEVKLTILVHTKHAQAFNRMLAQLDPGSQMNLLQVTEMTPATAMLLAERIEAGGFVVIAGDRIPVAVQPRVAYANFLGQKAAFPVGPFVMAGILQCPVYLLFSLQMDGRPQVCFEMLRESVRLPRRERDQALQALVAEYAARLEHYTVRAPLQWFNFYDFWHLPYLEETDATP